MMRPKYCKPYGLTFVQYNQANGPWLIISYLWVLFAFNFGGI